MMDDDKEKTTAKQKYVKNCFINKLCFENYDVSSV